MNWKIDYLEEDGIVRIKMLAQIGLDGVKQLCIEANSVAREHKSHKYFLDHRGVDIVMSVPDINRMPDAFREVDFDLEGKTAILLDRSAPGIDLFRFVKDVLARAWMHVGLFIDENDAINWLKSV